jgi:hypothetical protein
MLPLREGSVLPGPGVPAEEPGAGRELGADAG